MEKERYTIESFEIDEPSCIFDNNLKDLLNQQDAIIKILEEIRDKGNQKLENYYNEKIDELDNYYNKHFDELIQKNNQFFEQQLKEKDEVIEMLKSIKRYDIGDMLVENIKLKESQNAKAVEVLTDILVNLCSKYSTIFGNHDEPIRVLDVEQISDFIMSQIKELRGGK